MDKFCDETTMPEPTLEFEPAYNRHYIAVDEQGRIVDGWSDGPHPGRDTSGAICIDGEGGYQFRLLPGGEENPPLSAEDGVPLYRWDGETAVPRTMEEIEADRAPSLELVQAEKLAQLSAACNAAIVAGCGVELPDGGRMVRPDFLLLTNNICNQLTKWYENLAKQLDIPIFFIDTCYNPNDYVTESRVRYVRAQIDQLIHDLCACTGKTWDEARFRKVMKISQENSRLWERANNLMDHKPAPIGGFELFNYMSAMVCNRGKTSTTAIMEQLNREMEENIALGKSTFPVDEQYRVSWDGIACWPYLSHNLRTLKQYGINMVASSYGKAWAIEYDDLDGMARAYCFASTNGDNATTMLSRRLEALKRMDCEGTIYHVNRSCKVMDCQMMEVQRQLSALAGVPFTSFDGDQADYRNYSESQFETRIQGLVEVMRQNREARENG